MAWAILPTLMITGTILTHIDWRPWNGRKAQKPLLKSKEKVKQLPITTAAKGRNSNSIGMDIEGLYSAVNISNLSGKQHYIAKYKSLKTIVASHSSDDDGTRPVYKSVVAIIDFFSSNCFEVTPFLVMYKESGTFTSGENSSTDPMVVLDDALNCDYIVDWGPQVLASINQDATKWRGYLVLDLTDFANAYATKYAKEEISEGSIPELDFGVAIRTQDNGVDVTARGRILWTFGNQIQSTF